MPEAALTPGTCVGVTVGVLVAVGVSVGVFVAGAGGVQVGVAVGGGETVITTLGVKSPNPTTCRVFGMLTPIDGLLARLLLGESWVAVC